MTINFNHLDMESHNTLRQQMIEAAEGRSNVVYIDSIGMATIGIGLNLSVRSVARDVLFAALNRDEVQIRGQQIDVSDTDITNFLALSSRTFATGEAAQHAINTAWRNIASRHGITITELSLQELPAH